MINKAIIVGNLGNDPEIKYTQNGSTVATFSVATTERWKDKSGQQKEETEWHRITAFGKLADICGEYLRKGSRVYIEGKIKTDKWQDKNGNDRYSTGIVAREMKMLDRREESSGNGDTKYNDDGSNSYSTGSDVPF